MSWWKQNNNNNKSVSGLLSIKPSKWKLAGLIIASLALISSTTYFTLHSIHTTNALGATSDQITTFNNTVSNGNKEAYIITIDTTKKESWDTSTPSPSFTLYAKSVTTTDAGTITPNYNVYCDIANSTTPTATNQTGNYTCNYTDPGTYTIAVTGVYPYLSVYGIPSPHNTNNAKKLLSVNQWGTNQWRDVSYMFTSASNFNQIPDPNTEIPNTSSVTNMSYMFSSASAFNQPLANWDTSSVTNMSGMFSYSSAFNQPVGDWDTSKVTNMSGMFVYASAFNQPISNWDTSSVIDMSYMFSYTSAFNQPIGNWDVSKVTNMDQMFDNAHAFNQPIDSWDTSNVTSMYNMFQNATAFNQPLTNWDTSKVINMSYMFSNASSFNQPLSDLDLNGIVEGTGFDSGLRGMLQNSGLSLSNYEKTLKAWSTNPVTPNDLTLGSHGLTYCDTTGRDALIAKGWTIENDSQSSTCQADIIDLSKLNLTVPDTQTNLDLGSIAITGGTGITSTVYSLVTGEGDDNNDLFTIDSSTGKLSFKSTPHSGTYRLRVQASTNADTDPKVGFDPLQRALTVTVTGAAMPSIPVTPLAPGSAVSSDQNSLATTGANLYWLVGGAVVLSTAGAIALRRIIW